jgi:hypothetical protein
VVDLNPRQEEEEEGGMWRMWAEQKLKKVEKGEEEGVKER